MSKIGALPKIITGLVPIISKTAEATLTTAQVKGHLVLVKAGVQITLPPVIVGATVTIYSTTAAEIGIKPNDNDRIILGGTPLPDATALLSASGQGDYITLIGDSPDGWTDVGKSGAWTAF